MKLYTFLNLYRSKAIFLTLLTLIFSVKTLAQPFPAEPPISGELEVLHVQGNVWLIAGGGGNIAVQAGEQGVMVVDTGANGFGEEVINAIASISDRPIRYIVNTALATQHIGGNTELANLPGGLTSGAGLGARINVVSQENVLFRMSVARDTEGERIYPQLSWPTDGYFEPQRGQIFNGEAIDIIHVPNAYSDGDSLVYFRGSNVLVSGDVFTNTSLPLINYSLGGSLQGSINALDQMLDITISDNLAEGGTYVIPGHGYISDEADLVEYRDMAYIVRDRLQRLIVEEGLSLDQVKQARPILGWEARYSRPEWTADMFIEAVYDEFQ
ncbi:MAG: MBL fold metallo-hydrolase [Gammaproteobacteria bacterium]|jgi:cyclase|nr:MBL fold metallo-hydrolase [Gammaproteobacteria bacterium]